MNKFYVAALSAFILVACGDSSSSGVDLTELRDGKSVAVTGVAERGFFLKADSVVVKIGNRTAPDYWVETWGEYFPIDSNGNFSVKADGFRSDYAELWSPDGGFFSYTDDRYYKAPELKAAVDLTEKSTVRMNYLTSIIVEPVWYNMRKGMTFKDAWNKAATTLLKCLHMPENLTNFMDYSLYGETEGDAVLAAITLLIERAGSWYMFTFDQDNGEFCDAEKFYKLASASVGFVYGDELDSIRHEIESSSPTGKVANYEKYLSMFFADNEGFHRCDESTQGKLIGYQDYYYDWLVCDNLIWRRANPFDFDTATIFNASREYGTLVDSRDGQSYRTIEIEGLTYMAENLNYADSSANPNIKGQSWCYNDDKAYCDLFGRMYSWSAAMDLPAVYLDSSYSSEEKAPRGICPEGWHVASSEELDKIWRVGDPISAFMTGADNSSGFSVIPGGLAVALSEYGDGGTEIFTGEVEFWNVGEKTYIWTRDVYGSGSADSWYYSYSTEGGRAQSYGEYENKHHGHYVRCVQDYDTEE